MEFCANEMKEALIVWIRAWFEKNGRDCNAVIGISGGSDEQKLGFTYAVLDRYVREGICEDAAVRERIDHLHRANRFKLEMMPVFESGLEEKA